MDGVAPHAVKVTDTDEDRSIQACAFSAEVAGKESIVGRRLDELQDYYGFVQRERTAPIEEWRERYGADRG
ncbi:hypothetical protein [Streptomyces sp. NPDC088915]|uniref:hypothetical protein n=1 Tax=Streptomyces sp. NPDC088915 TaxID=3365912 RepID=UPI0037F5DD5D